MKKEEIMYGVQLGYQIGRMEFIWDSPFEEAKAVFEEILEGIVKQLAQKGCVPQTKNYQVFVESVLTYFGSCNMEIYAMLLVGIGAFRNVMAKSIGDDNPNKRELVALAKSAFDGIPTSIIKQPNFLYEKICNENAENIIQIVDVVCEYLNGKNNTNNSVDALFF